MIEIEGIKFYTTAEIADKLHISIQTVRKYVREKRMEGHRIGHSLMISENALARFLNIDPPKQP